MKRIEFLNTNNEKIVGVYRDAKSKGIFICCHGYQSTKDDDPVVKLSNAVYDQGYSIFRFDCSGHGESEGRRGIDLIKQTDDVLRAIDHFKEYKEIYIVGGSLGCAVGSMAAKINQKVNRLVLINGFFGTPALGSKYIYVYLQFRLAALFSRWHRDNWNFLRKNLKPERIKANTLILHARKDKDVYISQSRGFFSKLRTKKKLVVLKDADHDLSKQEYIDEIAGIIGEWLKN